MSDECACWPARVSTLAAGLAEELEVLAEVVREADQRVVTIESELEVLRTGVEHKLPEARAELAKALVPYDALRKGLAALSSGRVGGFVLPPHVQTASTRDNAADEPESLCELEVDIARLVRKYPISLSHGSPLGRAVRAYLAGEPLVPSTPGAVRGVAHDRVGRQEPAGTAPTDLGAFVEDRWPGCSACHRNPHEPWCSTLADY